MSILKDFVTVHLNYSFSVLRCIFKNSSISERCSYGLFIEYHLSQMKNLYKLINKAWSTSLYKENQKLWHLAVFYRGWYANKGRIQVDITVHGNKSGYVLS